MAMRGQAGQATAEFALVLPFLLLLVMATLYTSLFVLRHMQVHAASVQGARVGLEKCRSTDGNGEDAVREAAGALAPGARVTVVCGDNNVEVTVEQSVVFRVPGWYQVQPVRHKTTFPLLPSEEGT